MSSPERKTLTAKELAEILGAELIGDGSRAIDGVDVMICYAAPTYV